MPNRLLRNTTESEHVNILTYPAEVLFYRLMMVADDYGSFHANVKLVKSYCYPLRIDTVRDADLTRWMDELQKAGLIVVYIDAGKSFLRIVNFGQRLRNKKKRFPDCPPDILASSRELQPLAANGGDSPPEVEVEEKEEVERELSGAALALSQSNLFRKPVTPTLAQVKEAFYKQGGNQDMALKFFNKHESTGWFLNGSPIVKWSALVGSYIATYNSKETNRPDEPKKMVF